VLVTKTYGIHSSLCEHRQSDPHIKQERGDKKKADRQAFMSGSTTTTRRAEKPDRKTAALRTEVDKIMAADHSLMLQKLDGIQELVATFSAEWVNSAACRWPRARRPAFRPGPFQFAPILDTGDETLLYISAGSGRFALQNR